MDQVEAMSLQAARERFRRSGATTENADISFRLPIRPALIEAGHQARQNIGNLQGVEFDADDAGRRRKHLRGR